MSVFRAQTAGNAQAGSVLIDVEPEVGMPSYCTHSTSSANGSSITNAHIPGQTVLTASTTAVSSAGSPADTLTFPYGLTSLEAEESLTRFRTQHLKYFPFVYIPPNTTVEQLRQDRPFLWLCIMAVSSKRIAQQQALSKRIKNIVAQRMLYEPEYSLDLLLGLLAFIAWYESFRTP